jgi:hypothetical protein
LRAAKWGFRVSLRGSNTEPLMSALCQKQTLCAAVKNVYSITYRRETAVMWHRKVERFGNLKIDDQLKFGAC